MNKIDHWTFIQIFDITGLTNEFSLLQQAFNNIKSLLKNSNHTEYEREFKNSYKIIDILNSKISSQIKRLNPQFYKRYKRALIDGLGSIIKSITGNLDYRDAERYDLAINTLTNNQNEIKTLMKDQITLLQRSINKFKNNIQNLEHNQIILKSRILQLEQVIRTIKMKEVDTHFYFLLQMLITQISGSFQIISNTLNDVEVAITFSKLNSFHNYIVDPDILLNELIEVKNLYKNSKFPFELKIDNMLLIEKLIEVKSYSKGNEIVFILEVPIVETDYYDYYRLYPLPTPSRNKFKTIIPHSNYLMSNDQRYAYSDTNCLEVKPETFLCKEFHAKNVTQNYVPCELQLLKYSSDINNCKSIPIEVDDIEIEKINRNQWIIISPYRVVTTLKCKNLKNNTPISGTYLIELFSDCEVKIKDTILRTFKDFSYKTKFENINLPNLNISTYDNINNDKILHFKPINLKSNDFSGMQQLYSQINNHSKKLSKINNDTIYFNKTSIFTILLYILIIITFISYTTYKFLKYKKSSVTISASSENTETRTSW